MMGMLGSGLSNDDDDDADGQGAVVQGLLRTVNCPAREVRARASIPP